MNARMATAVRCEAATADRLVELGFDVAPFGQGDYNAAARQMLRGVPTPERWVPDFIVTRPPHSEPRWPPKKRGKKTFLVDAKTSLTDTGNASIEMRSLLAAQVQGLDTYYVHSLPSRGSFTDFRVMFHRQVLHGRHYCCCQSCAWSLLHDPDPMHTLPTYCPAQGKSRNASATPFVYVACTQLSPLTDFVFDVNLDGRDSNFVWRQTTLSLESVAA